VALLSTHNAEYHVALHYKSCASATSSERQISSSGATCQRTVDVDPLSTMPVIEYPRIWMLVNHIKRL